MNILEQTNIEGRKKVKAWINKNIPDDQPYLSHQNGTALGFDMFLAGHAYASTASQGLKWQVEANRLRKLLIDASYVHWKGLETSLSFDEWQNDWIKENGLSDESTPTDDRAAPDYPTYEQAGGNKTWDDMTELEKAYYDIRKLHDALAVSKNNIKSLRKKIDDRAEHAMAFNLWFEDLLRDNKILWTHTPGYWRYWDHPDKPTVSNSQLYSIWDGKYNNSISLNSKTDTND